MGREVRRVPQDWKHPLGGRFGADRHKPLFYGAGGRYEDKAQAWIDRAAKWHAGERAGWEGDDAPAFYWDFDGPPPLAEDFMLVGVPDDQCTHFQLYESTTEGTPRGPVFATLEEVVQYAAAHESVFADIRASEEEWRRMLSPGGVVAAEVAPGVLVL